MNLNKLQIKWLVASVVAAIAITAVLFFFVFPGKVILPQQLSVGSFNLHYYGLILSTSIVLAFLYLRQTAWQSGLKKSQIENLALVVLIFGFIGARAYHVFSDFELYENDLAGTIAVWRGGLSIFGAVIGGLLGLLAYYRWGKIQQSLIKLMDLLAPAVLLGQILGRFGNLFNYEAYGLPTSLPWKMFVPIGFRDAAFTQNEFFHPLFLYESLAGLLLFWVLVYFSDVGKTPQQPSKTGRIFALWLGGYGLIRFLTELLRVDSHDVFGIRINLFVSGLMVLIGIALLFYQKSKLKNEQLST